VHIGSTFNFASQNGLQSFKKTISCSAFTTAAKISMKLHRSEQCHPYLCTLPAYFVLLHKIAPTLKEKKNLSHVKSPKFKGVIRTPVF
jgi:hypothetical protein